jgi:excisionase family DNA binding protein
MSYVKRRKFLKPKDVSEMLNIGLSTVYEMAQRGELPAIKVGGNVRIPEDELNTWIERQLTGTAK